MGPHLPLGTAGALADFLPPRYHDDMLVRPHGCSVTVFHRSERFAADAQRNVATGDLTLYRSSDEVILDKLLSAWVFRPGEVAAYGVRDVGCCAAPCFPWQNGGTDRFPMSSSISHLSPHLGTPWPTARRLLVSHA